MKSNIYILVCLMVVLVCSCNRRSGRLPSNSKPKAERCVNGKSSIIVETSEKSRQPMSGSQIFQKYNDAVFMVYTSDGYNAFQGSGFFISPSGVAVSNYHVFKDTSVGLEVIKLSSGEMLKVEEVIAKSEDNDFIIFRVKAKSNQRFKYIPVSSRTLSVGEKIYTIGSPRGLENTFSSGEVSQKRENNIIQINAPIDHGSSGGALINMYGEAVGITFGGRDDSGANLNFAIDIKVVRKVLKGNN